MEIKTSGQLRELQENSNSLLEYGILALRSALADDLYSIVLVRWTTEDHIDTAVPLGSLDMVQQLMLICPQASLRVYEPEYWGSSYSEALSDESSNLLSVLESWFEKPERSDEVVWLDAQQELIRPIIFVAGDFGGLLVQKVSTASPWSLLLSKLTRPYYKLTRKEELTLLLPELLVLSV